MSRDDPRTDEVLVAAANAGDAAAFEALYHRYRGWVVRLAFRVTGNREDALDVLQETFVYLLNKFPGFRLTATMTTFLYPVVKNTSLTVLRKKRRVTDAGNPLTEVAAPAQPVQVRDTRNELATVLAALPGGQREVLLMRFVDGMTINEIAAALAIPPGTVKSRLHNALNTLREDDRTRSYFAP